MHFDSVKYCCGLSGTLTLSSTPDFDLFTDYCAIHKPHSHPKISPTLMPYPFISPTHLSTALTQVPPINEPYLTPPFPPDVQLFVCSFP